MAEELVRVRNLHYTYATDGQAPVVALRGVDLRIDRGEHLAIIGHNGSGKSTLARCLNGLLRPTEGDVVVNGLNTRDDASLIAVRSAVGMVFQNPDNQFVSTVVEDEVAFGPENLGVPRPELVERVERALAVTGLDAAHHRDLRTLSAGDKARLAIAGALAMTPDVLVLDEATVLLDPAGRVEILRLLDGLHAGGLTLVTITHHMEEAVRADRVVVLEAGRVALEGTPREVFARAEELERLGLSLPVAAAVARGLRRRGLPISGDLLTPQELVMASLRLAEGAR